MRIAMIGQRGVPATYGGIERYVEELGSRLAARGHEVTVFVRTNYARERPPTHRGLRLRYLPTVGTKHLDAIVHTALSTASAGGSKFDVIHFQGLGPGLLAPLAQLLASAAIVLTVHGLDHERGKWGWFARQVLRTGCLASARIPDATIANAHWLVDYYAREYGASLHYVPNGIAEVARVEPGTITQDLQVEPGRYILFVARFVPEKGVDLLLTAFSKLSTDLKLLLVGDSTFSNEYADHVRQLAKTDRRVIVAGFVYADALAELFTNAAIFVTASLVEGMPLTLLTAAAYDIPIIASDIPAHREALGSSAIGHLLTPPGDSAAIADAMAATLQNPNKAREAARKNRERILAHHDWDSAALRTEQVYEQALAAK